MSEGFNSKIRRRTTFSVMMNIASRITQINSTFESCDSCFVRLMIFPEGNHPEEITSILGIAPSKLNVAGEKVVNHRGMARYVKYSAWFLSSEEFVGSKDLRDHIDWLVGKLNLCADGWKAVQNLKGVKITLKCVWLSKLGHSGPVLWPEQMKSLADLNLECSFDIYFPNE